MEQSSVGAVGRLLSDAGGEGEEAAWEELVQRYGPRLEARVQGALRRCGAWVTGERVEELVQEVYCRLLQRRGRGRLCWRHGGEAAVAAYLGRVAECVVVDRLRHEKAEKRGGVPRPEAVPEHVPCGLSLADPSSSPEERAVARDACRRLLRRCRALEPGEQGRRDLEMLLLAVVGGWTHRELARFLPGRLAPSSVSSRLHRIKQRVRREWM